MVVGVDVHKRSHTVALLDGNAVVCAVLTIPNSPAGAERLLGWLDEHDARGAIVGIENAAGYGRLLCAALSAAGSEVLNVPAWRTTEIYTSRGQARATPATPWRSRRSCCASASSSARRSSPS
jgi:Transposase